VVRTTGCVHCPVRLFFRVNRSLGRLVAARSKAFDERLSKMSLTRGLASHLVVRVDKT
jgi:hypothetical protein